MSTLPTRRLSLCQALTLICLLVSAVYLSSQPSSSWVSAWGPSEGRSARARRQLHYRNEWASWNGWSVCSRSCGGGASVRTRTCITRNPVGGPCSGDPRQYKICNTKGCAGGSEDFREMQCSAYNDRPLVAGNSYRWTTFHGGSNPCELSCLAQGHNFYYNFGRVLDGTACSKEPGDVCVNGKCLVSDNFVCVCPLRREVVSLCVCVRHTLSLLHPLSLCLGSIGTVSVWAVLGLSLSGQYCDCLCLGSIGTVSVWAVLGLSLSGQSWECLCLDSLGTVSVWTVLGLSLSGQYWDCLCLDSNWDCLCLGSSGTVSIWAVLGLSLSGQ
uniref:ADAMTS like 5 n=1 Tax=Oncorhynchus kisutch TaxID=8019 RepID=A0A8C7L540_ONCKI